MVDQYQTTTTKTAKVEIVKLKSYVRLGSVDISSIEFTR